MSTNIFIETQRHNKIVENDEIRFMKPNNQVSGTYFDYRYVI